MLVEERGNVESFLVLVPLTLLFIGVLTLLLFLQIRISHDVGARSFPLNSL